MAKVNSFWQPVKQQKQNLKPAPLFSLNLKPQKVKPFAPVNLKIYPARTSTEIKLIDKKPFGDKDKDKVPNYFDCRPMNKRKQGFHHEYSYSSVASKKIKTVKMPPELFLKTTYGESVRRGVEKGYNRYKDDLLVGAEGIKQKVNHYRYIKGELVKLPKTTKETGIKKRILSDEYHLPIPFLQFDEKGKQKGHEGRHTALTAQKMGLKYIPVTIEKPKEVRLSSKYETLEPIEGKQYEDWTYNEKKREMNPSPVVEIKDLQETRAPNTIKEQVKQQDIKLAEAASKGDWIKDYAKKTASTFVRDKRAITFPKNEENLLEGTLKTKTTKKLKSKITKNYAEYLDAKYGLDLQKEGKSVYVEPGEKGYENGLEVIDDTKEIDTVEDIKDQEPSQDIVEDSIEKDTGETEEKYEGSAQELIDTSDEE